MDQPLPPTPQLRRVYECTIAALQDFTLQSYPGTRMVDANCRVATDFGTSVTMPELSSHFFALGLLDGVLMYSSKSPEDIYKLLLQADFSDHAAITMVMVLKKLCARPNESNLEAARRLRWGGFSYPEGSSGRLAYFTAARLRQQQFALYPRIIEPGENEALSQVGTVKVLPLRAQLISQWERL